MDEPSEILGYKHRMYRHDPYTTPQVARRLFGEYADDACLDHIRLDREMSRETYVAAPFKAFKGVPRPIAYGSLFCLFVVAFLSLYSYAISSSFPLPFAFAFIIALLLSFVLYIPVYLLLYFFFSEK